MTTEIKSTLVTHMLFRPDDKFQVISITTDENETIFFAARADVTAQQIIGGDESGVIRPFHDGEDALKVVGLLNVLP